MKNIRIADITLREFVPGADSTLSFREKLEIARILGKLGVDVVELPSVRDRRADILTGRTIAAGVTGPVISGTCGLTEQSVQDAWDCVKEAEKPALQVAVPVSPVQMEYVCGKKPAAVLELIETLVERCAALCGDVEFSALDCTRAEPEFLKNALETAVRAGAGRITLCDSAGTMTPVQLGAFIKQLRESVPALEKVELSAQVSDALLMATACALSAIDAGVTGIKTTVTKMGYARMEHIIGVLDAKGAELGVTCGVRTSELHRCARQLAWMLQTEKSETSPFENGAGGVHEGVTVTLTSDSDVAEVVRVTEQLGHSLSEEDQARVYEAVMRVAAKKQFVGSRELEVIIATTAMQVPPAYRIESYTVTSGNLAGAMASIVLEKSGRRLTGVSAGDGPIDASFLAIEKVTGHHYELDEFQIQAVTEGREAMGSALIKLRTGGGLYSGSGISTDVIGAAIRAYVSALNKIVYEEG